MSINCLYVSNKIKMFNIKNGPRGTNSPAGLTLILSPFRRLLKSGERWGIQLLTYKNNDFSIKTRQKSGFFDDFFGASADLKS